MKVLFIFVVFVILLNLQAQNFKTFYDPIEGELPFFQKNDLNPVWKDKEDVVKITDYQMISQRNKKYGPLEMKGKVKVVNFFFATCQGYCPTTTTNIKRTFNNYEDNSNIDFLSYSVTPNIDNVDNLRKYAKRYDVRGSNWHFLTGNRNDIYQLARKELFADMALDLNLNEDQFVHSEEVFLIDQNNYLRGVYNSRLKTEMEQLAQDIKLLL